MIEEITIENLGVIAQANISFGAGMNALTGETGAGKTMALTSLMLLMGAKAASAKVRHGQEYAQVTGVFTVPIDSPAIKIVEEAGGTADKEGAQAEIIVSRRILASGRSRAYLGGVNVPVTVLREIASELFTVHGQQDQIRLVSKSEHLKALDQFAQIRESKTCTDYYAKWKECRELSEKLARERENAASMATERLALDALVQRVNAVEPGIGEDDELRAQTARLENVENLREALVHSVQLLEGDEYQSGALSLIDTACHELNQSRDDGLRKYAEALGESIAVIADVRNELSNLLHTLESDPMRLEEIHQRRAQLTALMRELGMDIPTMLQRRDEAQKRLAKIMDPEKYLQDLSNTLQEAEQELEVIAAELTTVRRKAAKKLSAQVTQELQILAMKDAKFEVRIGKSAEFGKYGIDDVEFLFAPHAGSELSRLTATASGGEMSRIMLAIEVALAKRTAQSGHTFIFDEVDAGIGGETALKVGLRLGQLAQNAQVIAVTHLAQVAAAASTHLVVEKESSKDSARTNVRIVAAAERESELARMLSGQTESQTARAHAAELINEISVALLKSGV